MKDEDFVQVTIDGCESLTELAEKIYLEILREYSQKEKPAQHAPSSRTSSLSKEEKKNDQI